jgi:hypothetical protein
MMSYTCQIVFVLIAMFPMLSVQEKNQQKDPARHYEGVVSNIDKSDPASVVLTITIKEMRPTSREDEVTLVDKKYDFKVERSTKIIGLDGKPDSKGLASLPNGTKVRIETKPKSEKSAVEVKILPQD